MDKANVFIDAGFLDNILKEKFKKSKIDLALFSDEICKRNNSERLRSYYYTCMPYQSKTPTNEERKRYSSKYKFISIIKNLPRFEVRLGKLSKVYKGQKIDFKQKRVDSMMNVDMVHFSWSGIIQKAILITGDSDFIPGIKAIKSTPVITILYTSKKHCHNELYEACDEKYEIDEELIKKCALN